jgi:enoyl-CoA hydratase
MSQLLIEERSGVGHLSLNRGDAVNALSREFCTEIDSALRRFDASESVSVILITSALKHFSAGTDIHEMATMSHDEVLAGAFTGCVSFLPEVSKPVIVAVNGLAAGAGCELVEMCDIVIAGESAKFYHPEITLAATPGAGGTQRLSWAVGKHIAMDLLLTGRALGAAEAHVAGLVSRVVADDELASAAWNVARQVAAYSGPVARRIKALVKRTQPGLEAGLESERNGFHQCFVEEDFHEGLAAFIARRPANFARH